MGIVSKLKGLFSRRERALELYRSGMAKAKKKDFSAAITAYTACMQAGEIPRDVKAMALYNRALAYSAIDEDEKAAEDLAAVLQMPKLPESIKTAASQRRERIRRRGPDVDKPPPQD